MTGMTLEIIQKVAKEHGRVRVIDKGPRTIDIDIIFFGDLRLDHPKLTLPHPDWFKRSFVVYPLKDIPYFEYLSRHFSFEYKEYLDLFIDSKY